MATDTPFVKGADKLRQRVATIRRNLNLPAMTEEIAGLLVLRTLRRFDRQVTPDEVPWKPLSEATLMDKRRKGFADKPSLRRTDALRSSIKAIRGGLGATFINTGAGSRIGVDDPNIAKYATAQNKGTKKIPARRFLGLGALDIRAVDSLMRRKSKQLGLDDA